MYLTHPLQGCFAALSASAVRIYVIPVFGCVVSGTGETFIKVLVESLNSRSNFSIFVGGMGNRRGRQAQCKNRKDQLQSTPFCIVFDYLIPMFVAIARDW